MGAPQPQTGATSPQPLSAAARVHRWHTAGEGGCPPPRALRGFCGLPPHRERHLGMSTARGPDAYRDLPGEFSKHLQDALLPPWITGRGSMTAWEARIVGADWARKWGRWCAATRAPGAPAKQYAAIPLEG